MTFEELKYEAIHRQRQVEIDKLLYLYVKAQNYSDLLKAAKSTGNFEWILNNGFRDLVQDIPQAELEAENIYSGNVVLADLNTDVIILDGGSLTLTQSGTNRCRVIVDNGTANITLSDSSMVEIESYQNAAVTITSDGFCYTYLTSRDTASTDIIGNGNSTVRFASYGTSVVNANLSATAFVNCDLYDESIFNVNNQNYLARVFNEAQINPNI